MHRALLQSTRESYEYPGHIVDVAEVLDMRVVHSQLLAAAGTSALLVFAASALGSLQLGLLSETQGGSLRVVRYTFDVGWRIAGCN